jgi:hypothetical protein
VLAEDRADVLERVLVEAVLECERLELGGLDASTLLRFGDQLVERSDLMCRVQRVSPWCVGGSVTAGETSAPARAQARLRTGKRRRSAVPNRYNGHDRRSIPA